MARADYFDRALQAARDVLERFNPEAFLQAIDNHCVGIAFDGSIAQPEGAAAVDLSIRLIARFYPSIALIAMDATAKRHLRRLAGLAKAINPLIDISHESDLASDIVVIGRRVLPVRSDQRVLYAGSEGWIARLSRHGPVGSGTSGNPLGAGAAACLATANIFRGVFTGASLDDYIEFSVLNLDPSRLPEENPSLEKTQIGQVFLVGAGAIGNGFLWALARAPVHGELAVVDHDSLDLGNLQRYVLSLRAEVGQPKAQLAQALFKRHPSVAVYPVPCTWEDFVTAQPEQRWRFERVVVALDTANDRIGVQASLPRWIVNGWTRDSSLGVSRHAFLGEDACMACLYVPRREVPHEDEIIAQALGFPPEQLRLVRELIETGRPLDRHLLDQISAARQVPPEQLQPFEGRGIRELYTKAVCSGTVMKLALGPATAHADVPMPFQSALAGILQAAALFIHAGGLPPNPTITEIDLMRSFPPTSHFSRPERKATDHCFCVDPVFQEAYQAKYLS